ncbi:tat protein [Simian immunodeficiency virus]|uniref:Protein Tat n=1 Tax=Simian immunodeficiency virus TaxID=11723 RepID=I6LDG9_SIV|nr:tat protein [Simian immunodeficiency virus]
MSSKEELRTTPISDPFQEEGRGPCNKCYCKKCCYHCQLCFLQKGLGIRYVPDRRFRKRRRSTPSSNQEDKDPVSKQRPLSRATGIQKRQEETLQKVESKAATSGTDRKQDS